MASVKLPGVVSDREYFQCPAWLMSIGPNCSAVSAHIHSHLWNGHLLFKPNEVTLVNRGHTGWTIPLQNREIAHRILNVHANTIHHITCEMWAESSCVCQHVYIVNRIVGMGYCQFIKHKGKSTVFQSPKSISNKETDISGKDVSHYQLYKCRLNCIGLNMCRLSVVNIDFLWQNFCHAYYITPLHVNWSG